MSIVLNGYRMAGVESMHHALASIPGAGHMQCTDEKMYGAAHVCTCMHDVESVECDSVEWHSPLIRVRYSIHYAM